MTSEQPEWATDSDEYDSPQRLPPRRKNSKPAVKLRNNANFKLVWLMLALFGGIVAMTAAVFGIRFLHNQMEIAENQTKAEAIKLEAGRLEAARLEALRVEEAAKIQDAVKAEPMVVARELSEAEIAELFLVRAKFFHDAWNHKEKKSWTVRNQAPMSSLPAVSVAKSTNLLVQYVGTVKGYSHVKHLPTAQEPNPTFFVSIDYEVEFQWVNERWNRKAGTATRKFPNTRGPDLVEPLHDFQIEEIENVYSKETGTPIP